MIHTRLLLVNEQQTGSPPATNFAIDCPVFENIPVPLTLQVADVREPNNGTGSYSKSIKIPGTQEVNNFFENVYNTNISLQKFNPGLKVKAFYYVDELLNFEGYLQILNIDVDEVTKEVIYNCNILGDVITFFTKIKDRYLTDINWDNLYPSVFNASAAHVSGSWANIGGSGLLVCPFIDWGLNNSNMNFVRPQDLRPCLFVYDYLSNIFSAAGFTWTSTFLETNFFKRLIIPPTEIPALSSTVYNNNKFRAEADGTQAAVSNTLVDTSFPILYLPQTTYTTVQFQTVTYGAGLFSTPNFTPAVTNKYNLQANIGLNIVFKKNGVAQAGSDFTATSGNLTVIISGGASGMAQLPATSLSFALNNSNNFSIPLTNYNLTASVAIKVEFRWENTFFTTVAAGSGLDTWTIETKIVSGSNFSAEFTSNQVYEGIQIVKNDLIPPNIKQGEFISWLFREFNLYATVTKDKVNDLTIEPRPDFYLTTARDWTYKHDKSSNIQVIPLGELDNNKYTYTYKGDGDYFNKLYTDEYKEVYGIHRQNITNDFVKGENVMESGFSATPYAVNPNLPAIIPQILTKNNNVISSCKPNIRILYWAGSVALPTSQWTLTNGSGIFAVYNTIPAAGHTDNPYNPTLDLNWGFPKKIYAPTGLLPVSWTNNNLYNKYYSQYINQISDKNSKIIKTKFYLDSRDINIFDFRYPIFTVINGEQGYYLVNKIEDYNPLEESSTIVELLKLTDYAVFTPSVIDLGGGNPGNDSTNMVYNDNVTNNNNNTNLGESFAVIGSEKTFISYG